MNLNLIVSVICDALILALLFYVKWQTKENNKEIHQLYVKGKKCPYMKEVK